MGIAKLMDFIRSKFPNCVRSTIPLDYRNKIIAIDASNTMYQFLVKTQTITRNTINMPTDWLGNKTGHLLGLLYRSQLCMENNIKPIWVFDGRPPASKYKQLAKRKQRKEEAFQKSELAKEHGDLMEALKQQQRTVTISESEKADAIKLLKLMGNPVIMAPGEAEAQCALLAKKEIAYGAVTQDMDALTHGAPRLIRNFNKKQNTFEIDLKSLLNAANFTMDQFIDFCILCGCDYTGKISNIGPVRAFNMLQKEHNIEHVLGWIGKSAANKERYSVPEDFDHYTARNLFKNPVVMKQGFDLNWKGVDQEGIKEFLLEKQFSSTRIDNWLKKVVRRADI